MEVRLEQYAVRGGISSKVLAGNTLGLPDGEEMTTPSISDLIAAAEKKAADYRAEILKYQDPEQWEKRNRHEQLANAAEKLAEDLRSEQGLAIVAGQ